MIFKRYLSSIRSYTMQTTSSSATGRVGFIGLGKMGAPMALNLCRKFPTTIWNRSLPIYDAFKDTKANIADSPAAVAEQSDVVFVMLFDATANRSIFSDAFSKAIKDKIVVNTSTSAVEFSHEFADYVTKADAKYVEMPVSGSQVPAQLGTLVGLMAGDEETADEIRPYVGAITKAAVYCGPVGAGLKMKYSINTFLLAVTVGLAEAFNLAKSQDLEAKAFATALEASSLASAYSGIKVAKMMDGDWSAQGAIHDCYYNNAKVIQAAAKQAGTRVPVIDVAEALYKQAIDSGIANEDVIAVQKVIQDLQ